MLARTIYGFRLSVLFGFTLTIVSAVVGVAAGAVQGYFGGWIDLAFQRFMEVWSSVPTLYVLIILTSIVEPTFWWLLGILLLFSWMGFVGVVRAEFLRARNFDYVRAARALGASDPVDHRPPRAAERGGGDNDIPAVYPCRLGHRADRPRLPRHRPAARLPVAGRVARAGQGQPAGTMARDHRLRRHRADSVAADLHRRGGARRLRSAEGDRREPADTRHVRRHRRAGTPAPSAGRMKDMLTTPLLSVRDLRVSFGRGEREVRAVRGVSFDVGEAETVALVGESGSGKSVTALSALRLLPYPHAWHPSGAIRFAGEDVLTASAVRDARDARRPHGDCLPGAADLA